MAFQNKNPSLLSNKQSKEPNLEIEPEKEKFLTPTSECISFSSSKQDDQKVRVASMTTQLSKMDVSRSEGSSASAPGASKKPNDKKSRGK